ncbi:MAG: DUF1330 domain-containing protein [Pseudomonadota bacterium]
MPKGYLIGHGIVRDMEAYKPYAERNNALVAAYGGRFITRGGESVEVEGALDGHRHVIIEFPSYADAKAFYDSPEYQENMKIRQANASGHIVIVEGTPDE